MRSNFKALALALVAAFAMSAVAVSAAQANTAANFTTVNGLYPSVITGEQKANAGQTLAESNYFEGTPGQKVHCPTAKYEGTLKGKEPTLTVTPHYGATSGGCKATGALTVNAEVHLNGCHYLFNAGTFTTAPQHADGTAQVICPAGKQITITIGGICEVDVGPQTISSGITYTNLANGHVTIDVNAPIKYTDTDSPSAFFCPFAGNSEGVGKFVSSVTVAGYNDEGDVTDPITGSPLLDYKHSATERPIHVK